MKTGLHNLQSGKFLVVSLLALLLSQDRLFAADDKKVTTKTDAKKEELLESTHRLSITLGNNRKLNGEATLKTPPELVVKHTRNGITYNRQLKLSEITSIRLLRWESRFVRKNKEGEIYHFEPTLYEMVLSDESILEINGDFFQFLSSFSIKNKHGQVTLFTFWIDLLHKDGAWYTGLADTGARHTKECHNDTVRLIQFQPDDE